MSGISLFRDDVPDVVLESIFIKYDKDGSRSLEKPEILAMMVEMGLDNRQAELCFMMLDNDGNNTVSFEEWKHWFRAGEGVNLVDNPKRYEFVRRVADAFKKYDQDGSGVIDKNEFRALLASGGKDWKSCDDALIEQALRIVDKDGSGTVSFNEFLAWMEKMNENRKYNTK